MISGERCGVDMAGIRITGENGMMHMILPRGVSRRDIFSRSLCGMAALTCAAAGFGPAAALAQSEAPRSFTSDELLSSGHHFFGTISRGLAQTIEEATRRFGQPNGYVLGQELSGAFVGGLRYGEGILYTRNAGDIKVYWQGPSIGFDAGADGDRTMMLVYKLPATQAIYARFAGVDGSAYFVGGFGFTALASDDILVVPVRSGVGARLGINIGYLKFTRKATWNPF